MNHPSVFKFIKLLNSNGKSLKNLALYIAFERRNETVNSIVNKVVDNYELYTCKFYL